MSIRMCALGAIGAAVIAAGTASGSVMNDWGLILSGDYNFQGGDVRGRTILGGSLNAGGNSPVMAVEIPTMPQIDTVVVTGNVTAANMNMQSGNLRYGGTLSVGNMNHNGGGSTIFDPGIDISPVWNGVLSLSSTVASLAPTGTFAGGTFTNAGAGSIAVFNITAGELGPNNTLQLLPGTATTVLINVFGDNPNLGGVNFGGTGFGQNPGPGNPGFSNILWNFVDATTLNLMGIGFKGSLVAPFADVTGGSQIDGSFAAANYTGATEFHHFPFTGEIPAPGTVVLGGVCGVMLMRRRRAAC